MKRALLLAAFLAATAITTGCEQAVSGTVGEGNEDVGGGYITAGVNANQLCSWEHRHDYNPGGGRHPWARVSTGCGRSRSVWITCDVALHGPIPGSTVAAESHGTNFCQASIGYGYAYWQSGARGSEIINWYRLNNSARRWTRGFVTGTLIYCDRYFNSNGQHILRCINVMGGSPLVAAAVAREDIDAVRSACTADSTSPRCVAAQKEALANADKGKIKRYLNQRTRKTGDSTLQAR